MKQVSEKLIKAGNEEELVKGEEDNGYDLD